MTEQVTHREHQSTPEGFGKALQLFQKAAKHVPAYAQFLKEHQIDSKSVKTYADWQQVPVLTKANYFKRYSFEDLAWNRDLTRGTIISMSSGSTGQPFLWLRGKESLDESVVILDDLFAKTYNTKERSTLCIIAYAMGTWIAGTYMLSAMTALAERGHRVVSITPGINKDEIVEILRRIGHEFEQILIMGYPPFIKDTLELALKKELPLREYNLKFMFSSEHITETWRDYVLHEVEPNYDFSHSLCLYGAADIGIIGMESTLLIHLRRLIDRDPALHQKLFPETTILPTIVNYNPLLRFTEEVNGHLIITADNSLPLIRYDIYDEGKVMSQANLIKLVKNSGHKIPKSMIESAPNQPIIALYGRADVAAMFYGLNIYPENLKSGLETPELENMVTGKFTVRIKFDDSQEQSLHIAVELREKVVPTKELKHIILDSIVKHLRKHNNEYNKLCHEIGSKAKPFIKLIPFGSKDFQINRKHRWIVS